MQGTSGRIESRHTADSHRIYGPPAKAAEGRSEGRPAFADGYGRLSGGARPHAEREHPGQAGASLNSPGPGGEESRPRRTDRRRRTTGAPGDWHSDGLRGA